MQLYFESLVLLPRLPLFTLHPLLHLHRWILAATEGWKQFLPSLSPARHHESKHLPGGRVCLPEHDSIPWKTPV